MLKVRTFVNKSLKMNYEDRIKQLKSTLTEGETFVDISPLKDDNGYLLTVGDDDYHHSIALSKVQFEQLTDAAAEIMFPGINELFKEQDNG